MHRPALILWAPLPMRWSMINGGKPLAKRIARRPVQRPAKAGDSRPNLEAWSVERWRPVTAISPVCIAIISSLWSIAPRWINRPHCAMRRNHIWMGNQRTIKIDSPWWHVLEIESERVVIHMPWKHAWFRTMQVGGSFGIWKVYHHRILQIFMFDCMQFKLFIFQTYHLACSERGSRQTRFGTPHTCKHRETFSF